MLKKTLLLTLLAVSPFVSAAEEKVLNIYNWSDYIADDTVARFEKETGIKVRYDVYDSNEILQAKLLSGKSGYDIVVPTNAFLARQIQSGIYQKLDKAKLSNYKNLDPQVLKTTTKFDPGNAYAIPYLWGMNTVGINVKKVNQALGGKLPERQFDLLFKPEYVSKLKSCGVSVLDSPSEVFPTALHYLGKNPNSTDPADLKAAADLLKSIRPHITRFSSSGYINELANGELCLVFGYGGDLNIARRRAIETKNGVDIKPLVPKEGVELWFDSMVIPKDAKHPDHAHKVLNFIMRPHIIAAISTKVTYANGNQAARPLLDKSLTSDPSIYPSAATVNAGYVQMPLDPKSQRLITRYWQEIKTRK